ncbi:MAG TPA: MaoC family dehydratase N-terminal domain-containing protein [Acidimicrobiales bacterium]|jgi:acyl dehydratase|nr:MaoC family dehydratase N-terminal domain-containing protein [Acidimicrobiales bacterium]
MTVTRDEVVGMPTGKATIAIERGPVTQFAASVTDTNPIYRNRDAATGAGFENIPVPPTYFFSAATMWGAFPEAQPSDAMPGRNPTMEVIGKLMAKGGIVLHGEQEFTYHQPVVVGDTIQSEGKVVDLYEKPAGDKTMTFLVTENEYRNQDGELVLTARMNLIHRG